MITRCFTWNRQIIYKNIVLQKFLFNIPMFFIFISTLFYFLKKLISFRYNP